MENRACKKKTNGGHLTSGDIGVFELWLQKKAFDIVIFKNTRQHFSLFINKVIRYQ